MSIEIMSIEKQKQLSQFYTKPDYAQYCYNEIEKLIDLNNYFLIEPSAGNGAFSSLFHKNSIAFDIEPKKENITKKDFFDFDFNKIQTDLKFITIGNPPFGRNSSLALKLVNKSALYSDYVCFILPKTFKKNSVINRIDRKLHLIYHIDVPVNSFILNENECNVPCVFQIWEKREVDRELIIEKKTTEYFDFVNKEEADIAIRRVGSLAGKIFTNFNQYQESSHYFIKFKNDDKYKMIFQLKLCYGVFQREAKKTAGNPSLSKSELIREFEMTCYKDGNKC